MVKGGRYLKGARFERELARHLVEKGFMVVRAAGSGVYQTAPDLLAFRKHEHYAFECKAWDSSRLSLRKEQRSLLDEWEDKTGISVYVAWKIPRRGWMFIKPCELNKSNAINVETALLINRTVDKLV